MRRIVAIFVAMVITLVSFDAQASEYISRYVSDAQKVGEGRLSYLVWDVYDAELYAEQGKFNPDKPYALRLSYLMDIKGYKIADRSAQEMRDQKLANEVQLATWHAQMKKIFPNVQEGSVITGVYANDGSTIFYKDGIRLGRIIDEAFSEAFFGIWLNKQTSSPDLRRKLLGGQKVAQN